MLLQQSPSTPHTRRHSCVWHAAVTLLLAWLPCVFANDLDAQKLPPPVARDVDFARDVQPILERNCLRCHGEEKQKGELRLDTKATAFRGGGDGPAIVAGKSADSLLIQLVAGLEADRVMPAKGDRVTTEQIGILRKWIDSGAPWPDTIARIGDKRAWWSLQPLGAGVRSQESGVRNPIDGFIREKLSEKGMQPSSPADPRTLCRRLYFDLIGLPPTPEEVDAFVADSIRESAEAAAPGTEAAAYRDKGRQANGRAKWRQENGQASPQTYRFPPRLTALRRTLGAALDGRGALRGDARARSGPHSRAMPGRTATTSSRAFNADKPYAALRRRNRSPATCSFPKTRRRRSRSAFSRPGRGTKARCATSARTRSTARSAATSTATTWSPTVMQTFASTTVQCARCHDHKFDPISQRDYYALQAVFAGVDRANRRLRSRPDGASAAERTRARELRGGRDVAIARTLLSADAQREVAACEETLDTRCQLPGASSSRKRSSPPAARRSRAEHDGSLLASGPHARARHLHDHRAARRAGAITAVPLEVLAGRQPAACAAPAGRTTATCISANSNCSLSSRAPKAGRRSRWCTRRPTSIKTAGRSRTPSIGNREDRLGHSSRKCASRITPSSSSRKSCRATNGTSLTCSCSNQLARRRASSSDACVSR